MSAPLNLGQRLIRGAKRIGLLISVPVFAAGVIASIFWGYNEGDFATSKYDQTSCLLEKISKGLTKSQNNDGFYTADVGCPGKAYYISNQDLYGSFGTDRPSFINIFARLFGSGLFMSSVLALALYGLCWAIGWVCAGFTSD